MARQCSQTNQLLVSHSQVSTGEQSKLPADPQHVQRVVESICTYAEAERTVEIFGDEPIKGQMKNDSQDPIKWSKADKAPQLLTVIRQRDHQARLAHKKYKGLTDKTADGDTVVTNLLACISTEGKHLEDPLASLFERIEALDREEKRVVTRRAKREARGLSVST